MRSGASMRGVPLTTSVTDDPGARSVPAGGSVPNDFAAGALRGRCTRIWDRRRSPYGRQRRCAWSHRSYRACRALRPRTESVSVTVDPTRRRCPAAGSCATIVPLLVALLLRIRSVGEKPAAEIARGRVGVRSCRAASGTGAPCAGRGAPPPLLTTTCTIESRVDFCAGVDVLRRDRVGRHARIVSRCEVSSVMPSSWRRGLRVVERHPDEVRHGDRARDLARRPA